MRWGTRGLLAALAACVSALAAASGAGCSSSPDPDAAAEPDAADVPEAAAAATTVPVRDAAADAADAAADAADADAADASKPPSDGGAGFCASQAVPPRFCDDFDDGNLTDDWTQFAFAPGAVAELDGTSTTSAPAAFHVKTTATAAAASNNALLRLTLFAAVQHARLSFATFLPSVSFTKGSVAIATLDVSLDHFFTLYLRDMDPVTPTATLEEYVAGTVTRHLLTKLPPVNVWTRTTLDLDFVTGKASVTFGAEKALDAEPITALAGSEATVRIGAIIDGPAAAFEARFDDVLLDY